ncbi:hypothetical protein ABEI56_05375 [Peribacillus castrilensis]|uniref:hypothetical protein n=1 Tax=Peribacillus castrilensis TaxID=2897690 RepID=UPI003D2A5377
MKKKCPTCELIKTGGMFADAICTLHPNTNPNSKNKLPFFKGYRPNWFLRK